MALPVDGSMPERIVSQSPNEELAVLIATALVDARLVSETRTEELRDKLTRGVMRQEDWRLLIELAVPPEEDDNADTD